MGRDASRYRHLRIQDHKKVKFSGQDISSLAFKGLIIICNYWNLLNSRIQLHCRVIESNVVKFWLDQFWSFLINFLFFPENLLIFKLHFVASSVISNVLYLKYFHFLSFSCCSKPGSSLSGSSWYSQIVDVLVT